MSTRGIFHLGDDSAQLDALMAQLCDAIASGKAADSAEVMALQAQIDALSVKTADADAKAVQAEATGQNARDMVIRRDPALRELQELAATLGDARAAGDAAHVELGKRIDTIKLTPGPPGEDGTDGRDGINGIDGAPGRNGLDGAPGKPGTDGRNGIDGQPGKDGLNGTNGRDGVDGLSAYQLARQQGYGGTQAQWVASLKGDKGDTGQQGSPGTPADMARVAALETKVRELEAAKVFAVGIAATPALALLATQDITIELSREMPNTNYMLDLSRSQGLLTAGAVTFKSKTTTTVTYTLRAVVALGAGSLVVLARY